MDQNTRTKKGMNINSKTRVKVAGLINDLHLLQSLPGMSHDVAKNYKLGHQFMTYLRELNIIETDRKSRTVLYTNPKNHSNEYILDYVMSRYACEYIKVDKPSDLITLEVELPASMKEVALEAKYRNEIKNLHSDLSRQEARISILTKRLEEKTQEIETLTKKKSIFARIKTLFT